VNEASLDDAAALSGQKQASSDAAQSPEEKEETSQEEAQSFHIPDHVLTPTLADIYFQQGQPRMALQIYERLLQRSPDNDKIEARIEQVRAAIEAEEEQETPRQTPKPRSKTATSARKSQGSKAAKDAPPLKGVRIKRKVRERIARKKRKPRR
jgi:tetratricopeptide (TPR) repeat protein